MQSATWPMMKPSEDADIEVTWKDQQNINSFSKLNAKVEDLQEVLTKQKMELEYLDDLAMELELADEDEPVSSFKIGDAFIELSLEEAQNRLESEKAKIQEHVDQLVSKIDGIEEKLANLKKELYTKFKTAINLEKD
ncbi:hypothetical protein IWQ61_006804 [Dispira simplex]|nr:hypothetical protein IWQ61_006804 [Dispira simplex]